MKLRRRTSIECLGLLSLFVATTIAYAEQRPLPEPANPTIPSLFLIGDSTVRNGHGTGGNGQWGWGEPLAELFDASKLNVVNRAVGGLSSRTYHSFGYWDSTLTLLKPGDFLIMQFGHNDASAINDASRARGTLPGIGDESDDIVNQLTRKPETVHTYGWYLRKYIQESRKMGAIPVVCSPIPRKQWDGDKVLRSTDSYSDWAREVAESEGVPFIHLNEIIAQQYDAMGPSDVEAMFADKDTHTTLKGARLNARSVVSGLVALPMSELTGSLSASGQDVTAAKRAHVVIPDERPILDDTEPTTEVPTRQTIPSFYIMGDSTVRNGHMDGVGWGESIGKYFDDQKMNVVNRAIGGRSTRSYMRENRWQDIYDQLKPGDFVIMQFGHNDGGRVGDPRFKRRPAVAGIGDNTQNVTLDDGSIEVVHSYGWYLRQFCNGIKTKQAVPIICSPIPHKNNWRDGHFTPDFVDHRKWCRQVAEQTGAHFINLTEIIGNVYQELGEQKVDTLFADARTHTNVEGAEINAQCVIVGLKSLPTQPLNAFLSDLGEKLRSASASRHTGPNVETDSKSPPVDTPSATSTATADSVVLEESTPSWSLLNEFQHTNAEQSSSAWPVVRSEMRPGAIWWWPGSAVTKQDLTWNLEWYRQAGWGNLSLVGIYGVRGEEDRTIELFSPKWFEMYNHAIAEAKRLGMNIDLTPGGGWRWGGPHVTRPFAEQSFVIEENKIAAEPKNDKVKRAGKGGEGLTINPYSESAVKFHLDWFDQRLKSNASQTPRAFYYDSFENTGNWCPEFLDAFRQNRGYSLEHHARSLAGLGDEEESRRVIADYRKVLSGLLIDRVCQIDSWADQHDSSLRMQAHGAPANLLDMYAAAEIPETEVFGASKFNIAGFRRDSQWIRADQQSDLVNRFASSAAHVAGRPLITSESFTWLRNHYHTSLAHLKAESDKLLLNGINGIYYHGACFSPEKTVWPGWLFYASTQANPRNSIFRDAAALNAYITRCQSVLQTGRPHNDVLLYWPVDDLWMSGGKADMRFAVHHPGWIEDTTCGEAGRWLDKHGYTFDFISDDQLQRTNIKNGSLQTEGDNTYQTVLVPAAETMSLETAERLIGLARDGATVLIWKGLPQDVPGWFAWQSRREQMRDLFKTLSPDAKGICVVGAGKLVSSDNLEWLLRAADVTREPMVDSGLQFIRRRGPDEVNYFIANHTSQPIDTWVTISTPCRSAMLMDPMTAESGAATLRRRDGSDEVRLQMQSGETRILRVLENEVTDLAAWPVVEPVAEPIKITGPWKLQFVEGGPTLPADQRFDPLRSWADGSDAEAQRFAGAARYSTTVVVPSQSKKVGWVLNLGDVRESARVWVNGDPVGVVVAHPFQINLNQRLKSGSNDLVIEVTNLSANRIRDLDLRGVEWKKFHDINFVDHLYRPFDASHWDSEPSGLLGPVTLTPYRELMPNTSQER